MRGAIGLIWPIRNENCLCPSMLQNPLSPLCPLSTLGKKGGNWRPVVDKVRELNLLGSVIFTGVIENTYAYLSASDVFVFPSKFEGLGIVLIEAQANGLKCITSDRVPIEADATGNVRFLSLEDEKAWVNEMMNGKRDFSIASEVGEKVKRAGYDIHEVASELTEFYLSW